MARPEPGGASRSGVGGAGGTGRGCGPWSACSRPARGRGRRRRAGDAERRGAAGPAHSPAPPRRICSPAAPAAPDPPPGPARRSGREGRAVPSWKPGQQRHQAPAGAPPRLVHPGSRAAALPGPAALGVPRPCPGCCGALCAAPSPAAATKVPGHRPGVEEEKGPPPALQRGPVIPAGAPEAPIRLARRQGAGWGTKSPVQARPQTRSLGRCDSERMQRDQGRKIRTSR